MTRRQTRARSGEPSTSRRSPSSRQIAYALPPSVNMSPGKPLHPLTPELHLTGTRQRLGGSAVPQWLSLPRILMTALTIPTLATRRLILRSPVEADFPAYARLMASVRAEGMGGPHDTRAA